MSSSLSINLQSKDVVAESSNQSSTRPQSRTRDEKKTVSTSATTTATTTVTTAASVTATTPTTTTTTTTETKPSTEETMEKTTSAEDVYEFKTKETESPDLKNEPENNDNAENATNEDSNKRNFSEINDGTDDNDEESRKNKKRKDDGGKDVKGAVQRGQNQNKGQGSKQQTSGQSKIAAAKGSERKTPSPKPANPTSDVEMDDSKTDLKVPPLKIVIPQSGNSNEQEIGVNRNGKNISQRSHSLPYIVPSSASDSADGKEATGSGGNSPENNSKSDDKKDGNGNNTQEDQKGHQRVLRSSHRGNNQNNERSSNNSSPQLQRSHSPSPSASPAATTTQNDTLATSTVTTSSSSTTTTTTTTVKSDSQPQTTTELEIVTTSTTSVVTTTPTTLTTNAQSTLSTCVVTTPSTSTNTTVAAPPPTVELHPRKRKMKPNKELNNQATVQDANELSAEQQVHPHDQPITNCYQLFLNIRKQIEKRRRGLFPVQPKPPQGFKDYLMNRCTYVLASNAPTTPNITYPPTLPTQMKDLFTDQEKERYRLRMQHVIEKEKLVLSVEQEILRVHGRAARALANQSLPFSVCTILRDEEVYNLITPEQEEKDRNARSRYNGRLFLSWLQDVDDKWEKIKEHMLLRHHNEAESLHAVQKMDWEWKMKEMSLCDKKITPSIDEHHVPMVHVSDDFDLLPA